ncbi:hypothetical protein [Gluconacetobacter takamatsuzukensis]|uniref:Flagellar hook-length control protein FliK n=1 Tax=Gluconacetobacter takamatsuzukensis TaxID=1286190 RepID=A0A7W4KAW7_9PROT|nr:hypothetical protein [Gluconacetobacter takamatsuzukensis]MBB2203571.1 hypothetical protein [Gluconacetobacter takamatsuzukensis]
MSIVVTKASTKANGAPGSSSSSSPLSTLPGPSVSTGSSAVRPRKRGAEDQGSFNAHLQNASRETGSGKQDSTRATSESATSSAQTNAGTQTDSQTSGHQATGKGTPRQGSPASTAADSTTPLPTPQIVAAAVAPSGTSTGTPKKTGSDAASTSDETDAAPTSQAPLAALLSQMIGSLQTLTSPTPPKTGPDASSANGTAALANPADQTGGMAAQGWSSSLSALAAQTSSATMAPAALAASAIPGQNQTAALSALPAQTSSATMAPAALAASAIPGQNQAPSPGATPTQAAPTGQILVTSIQASGGTTGQNQIVSTGIPLTVADLATTARAEKGQHSLTLPDTASLSAPSDSSAAADSSDPSPLQESPGKSIAQNAANSNAAATASPTTIDIAPSPTSDATYVAENTSAAIAQSTDNGSMDGHSDSSDGSTNGESNQTAPQLTNGLTLPVGMAAVSTFATLLNSKTGDAPANLSRTQPDGTMETNGFASPSTFTQGRDGSASLSMTLLTDDSTPIHVRVEGTDGTTTAVVLQSEDQATARHLADNKHELVAALNAAGIDTSHLKIDIGPLPTGTNSNMNDQNSNNSTAYGSDLSGNMFGSNPGQNGQASYGNSGWNNTGTNVSTQDGYAFETQNDPSSVKPAGSYTGSGVNITA